MKVEELIEKLQQFDGKLEVLIAGCDCFGEAEDAIFYSKGTFNEYSCSYDKSKKGEPIIMITRKDSSVGKKQETYENNY